MPRLDLPEPDPDALAHSARVSALIRERLAAAGGWLPFSEYMALALYEPGLGYYSAGATKLGPAGDFVTAPEVSPLFGRCLARLADEVLAACGEQAVILELGAGSGALAASLLPALQHPPAEYLILEVSADLRARQRERLAAEVPELLARVRWLDALPEELTGLVLANEVLDALPVERFELAAGRAQRLGVVQEGEGFGWSARADAALAERVAALDLPAAAGEGYRSELPDYAPLIASLAASLDRGALLFVDYGYPRAEYYLPERRDGTLMAHRAQRAFADPFQHPGLCDLTAWVEYTALAEAGEAAGLTFAGYTSQAQLLIDCGLEQVVALDAEDAVAGMRTAQQVRWLTMPGEMGERFRAMGFLRELELADGLRGFGGPSLEHTL